MVVLDAAARGLEIERLGILVDMTMTTTTRGRGTPISRLCLMESCMILVGLQLFLLGLLTLTCETPTVLPSELAQGQAA